MSNEPNEAEKKLAKEIVLRMALPLTDTLPIALLLAAHRADESELAKELERAKRALIGNGFEDLGGQEWKPPVNQRAATLNRSLAGLRERYDELADLLREVNRIYMQDESNQFLGYEWLFDKIAPVLAAHAAAKS